MHVVLAHLRTRKQLLLGLLSAKKGRLQCLCQVVQHPSSSLEGLKTLCKVI